MAEQAMDHEVDRPQVGQHVAVDRPDPPPRGGADGTAPRRGRRPATRRGRRRRPRSRRWRCPPCRPSAPPPAPRGGRSRRAPSTGPGPVVRARSRAGGAGDAGAVGRAAQAGSSPHALPLHLDLGDDEGGGHGGRPVAGHLLGRPRAVRCRRRRGSWPARSRPPRPRSPRPTARSSSPRTATRRKASPRPERSPESSTAVSANAARPPGTASHSAASATAALLAHRAAGEDEGDGVAPAAGQVGGDLQRRGRGLAPGPADPHAVGPLLGEGDGVEPGHRVGAQVARAGDLVEELGGDRADGDRAPGPGVLGDDRRAVGRQLGEGEPDPGQARHLLEEGVVAAAALRPALDDVAGHHGPGQLVEVVGSPPEGPDGRAHHQGGVGDPPRHHHVGPRRRGRRRWGPRRGRRWP